LRIAFFREGRVIMRRTLRRSGAKRLFVVGNHAIGGVVAAARDLGLDTIEIQHGVLSRYHAGYHYPGRPVDPNMPDRLLTFGSFWASNLDLPGNVTSTVIGSDILASVRGAAIEKVRHRVVVTSNHPTDLRLFDAIIATAHGATDWEFIFRPHPWEDYSLYQSRLTALPARPENFHFSNPKDDLYELLASAEVQIGVCSTSLFEGMAMGARTMVFQLPGAEIMEPAVEQGDAAFARNPLEIVSLLAAAPVAADCSRYYAPPVPSILAAMADSSR
jgi:hypothetical protein